MWKFYRTQQVITTEYICLQHTPEMNGKLAITIHAIEKNWVTPAGTVNCKVSTNVLNKKLKDLQGEQCKLMDGYDLLCSHGMHEPEPNEFPYANSSHLNFSSLYCFFGSLDGICICKFSISFRIPYLLTEVTKGLFAILVYLFILARNAKKVWQSGLCYKRRIPSLKKILVFTQAYRH